MRPGCSDLYSQFAQILYGGTSQKYSIIQKNLTYSFFRLLFLAKKVNLHYNTSQRQFLKTPMLMHRCLFVVSAHFSSVQ